MAKQKGAGKVKSVVKTHCVIVYSTPACPWCRKAKEFLQHHKVAFKDFDVSADSKARKEMIKKSGQIGVPVLDIKGTIIIGYDECVIRAVLRK